jgi:hypothetical protein
MREKIAVIQGRKVELLDVTHKEIYDRLLAVEKKVDAIDTNTRGMVDAFNAAQGAFTVLDWMAKAVKPILWLVAAGAVVATVFDQWKKG